MDLYFIIETILIGIATVIVGVLISCVFYLLPKPTGYWNSYHYMEICLFLTGVVVHIGYKTAIHIKGF
jgi:uncharacterized membrane protein YczE